MWLYYRHSDRLGSTLYLDDGTTFGSGSSEDMLHGDRKLLLSYRLRFNVFNADLLRSRLQSLRIIHKDDVYSKSDDDTTHPYIGIWKSIAGRFSSQFRMKTLRHHLEHTWEEWNTSIARSVYYFM